MKESEKIDVFVSGIWDWFERHKRTLPWRDLAEKNPDHRAYLILVSEIMLQQTQVPRVVILYKKFIQRFPYMEDLSKASNRDVLIAWRGLGYNNRALRLRDAARKICEIPNSKHQIPSGFYFPREMDALMALPGVGHYTAAAIRNFAFGIPTACLDTNVRRILHRFFVGMERGDGTWKKNDSYLLKLSEQTMVSALEAGRGSSADWFAALMDFGSLVCTKNAPKWQLLSPELRSVCKAYGKQINRTKNVIKKEPGRLVGSTFVPNRIFRGKIVEALRDAEKGMSIEAIGKAAVADWSMGDHKKWLSGLLENLKRDRILQEKRSWYALQR